MSKQIKGITIEIGAETKGFKSGLAELNAKTRNLQTELKTVDRALKLDPKNTEMLTQKQELLTKAIEETKKKVEILKEAKEKADKEMESGTEINQEEYRKLQREIAFTENNLKNLENQSIQTKEKFDFLGEKAGKFNKLVAGTTVAGATAVVGIGATSVKVAADFDSSMSKVSAVSGATGKDLEDLRDKAKEMGKTTKFSAKESAEAFNYMAMAGWDTEQMLGGIEGVMNLASASGEDLATVSDILTDSLTAFGMKAEESGHFADVLAIASSSANTDVKTMGETFKYVAPVSGAMGYSIEDMGVAIGLMANAGIKGSQAGTQLRATISRMAKPTAESQKAMDDLGISMTNSDGSMKSFSEVMTDMRSGMNKLTDVQKASYSAMLGGQEAMSGLLAIVNASDEDFTKLTNAMNSATGSAETMAETMNDNLNGQLTKVKSQLEGVAIEIGEKLVPYISKLVEKFSGFVTWVMENKDGVIAGLSGIAAGLIAFNVVAMIQNLVKGFQAFKLAQDGVTISQYALNLAMSLNPIALYIGALVGLVVALVVAWNKSEKFREAVKNLWEKVKEFAIGIKEKLTEFKEKFVEVWESIKNSFKEKWDAICKWFETKITKIVDTVVSVKNKMFEAGKKIFTGLWEGIKNVWTNISSWVSEKVSWLVDKLTFWKKDDEKSNNNQGRMANNTRSSLGNTTFSNSRSILQQVQNITVQPNQITGKKPDNQSSANANITQNFYGVKEERTAFQVNRHTKQTLRGLGLA